MRTCPTARTTACTDPLNNFRVITIGDYSFIVNREVTVATATAPTSQPADLASWYTPERWRRDGTIPPEEYFVVAQGVYQGTKQSFEDLPNPADPSPPSEGDVWTVESGSLKGEDFSRYYVVRRGGVWEETFEPLSGALKFDEKTMPHALVREANGTFTFVPFAWTVRDVGDDQSNQPPSFVGQNIDDVTYYKNRLGFITDETVVFSGAADYANFWRTSVVDLIESDRVDVGVSGTKTPSLRHAVPVGNQLMLFGDTTQYVLSVDEKLTPTTVGIDPVTSYPAVGSVRPPVIGNDVFFPVESGNWSRIREYYVSDDGNQNKAADITAHCPKFVPKGIFDMSGNSNEDILYCISNEVGYENRIYVYRFMWQGEEKVQSSWSYWEMDAGDEIISIGESAETLYLLIQRADGVYLETLNVQSGEVAGTLDFQLYLDRRTTITGVWNGSLTTFTLPYPVPAGTARDNFRIVKGADFTGEVGALIAPANYTWASDTSITVTTNETDGEVWIGVVYESRLTFSEQFIRDRNGVAVLTGRLMLRTMTLYYTDTAFFNTEVDPYGTGTYVQTEGIVPSQMSAFTGKTIGEASFVIGEPTFHTGSFSFQIYGDAKKADISIVNDIHVGIGLQSAEWEGFYFNRS